MGGSLYFPFCCHYVTTAQGQKLGCASTACTDNDICYSLAIFFHGFAMVLTLPPTFLQQPNHRHQHTCIPLLHTRASFQSSMGWAATQLPFSLNGHQWLFRGIKTCKVHVCVTQACARVIFIVKWSALSGEEVTHKGPSVLVGRHYAFHFKVIFELWRQWARFMRSYGVSPLDLENH